MHGVHADLTTAVQTGLGWYYLLICLANLGFGWYQLRVARRTGQAFGWLLVAALFLVLGLVNFAQLGLKLPEPVKDWSDQGLHRGLQSLQIAGTANTIAYYTVFTVLCLLIVAGALDAILAYGRKDEYRGFLFRGLEASKRLVVWLLLITAVALVLYGTGPITYFLLSVAGIAAVIMWRRQLTEPAVAWGILNVGLLFGGLSMTDGNFRSIIIKPDNVPIVGLVGVVGFFTWLALRKGVVNDERLARGLPPVEKEADEKVLVWPDLVYTELICMVVVTVVLVVWAVALPAPIEQPASSTKTPNPSKAPWYFLGLQEMLVYYDPWLAGVVFPTIIIVGLMAIPYIDFNQKGNGYFTFAERPFAIVMFILGFIILWVTLIFLGTFLRGPNWNFFGLYEPWDPHKLVPLNNVNLSDYIWVRGLGMVWEHPAGGVSVLTILGREAPGILLILGYFLLLPPLLAQTVLRPFYLRMGFIRFQILVSLLLFMASLPIKMVLRWAFNLKYIVAIPEYFFNI
jgi:hypothetical protein